MIIKHQPKLKVTVVALIFGAFATIQPWSRYQAFAQDQQPEAEASIESPVPADESARSDESGQASGSKISDKTKKILVACLLLCNPLGLAIAGAAARGGAGDAALFILALPIIAPAMLIRDMYRGQENKEQADAYTLNAEAPGSSPEESQELKNTSND